MNQRNEMVYRYLLEQFINAEKNVGLEIRMDATAASKSGWELIPVLNKEGRDQVCLLRNTHKSCEKALLVYMENSTRPGATVVMLETHLWAQTFCFCCASVDDAVIADIAHSAGIHTVYANCPDSNRETGIPLDARVGWKDFANFARDTEAEYRDKRRNWREK